MLEKLKLFFKRNRPSELTFIFGFENKGPEVDAFDEEENFDTSTEELSGLTVGINYVDAKGAQSQRMITIKEVVRTSKGNYTLKAHCHLRKRFRNFRLDRIDSIIDGNGEIIEPEELFGEIDFHKTKDEFTYSMFPGIKPLAALAKIDGYHHPKETTVIMAYLQEMSQRRNVVIPDNKRENIARYVSRLYPMEYEIDEALEIIVRRDPEEIEIFKKYCIQVMDADGVQDEKELKMVMDLQEALSGGLK